MIIFGTTSTTKTLSAGTFHCPSCTRQQAYELKRIKKWFHLYWIPTIPMGEVARWVECRTCGRQFDENVLSHDPEKQAREFEAAYNAVALKLMIRAALVDGRVDPARADLIAQLSTEIGLPMTGVEVVSRAEAERGDDRPAAALLEPIAGRVSDTGKELMVRLATRVAYDGARPLTHAATDLITEIAKNLGVSSAHMKGIVAEVTAA